MGVEGGVLMFEDGRDSNSISTWEEECSGLVDMVIKCKRLIEEDESREDESREDEKRV